MTSRNCFSRCFFFYASSYESVLTFVYSNENEYVSIGGAIGKGAWAPVNGTEFLFFDGTSNEPILLRDVANAHYLSPGVKVTGVVLSGLALVFVIACGSFVFNNRTHKLILASQPEFLYLLCFGAALVAPCAIFLSFDEGGGVPVRQLSAMCSALPWLFVIGYLTMYCALFSKLWRLSMVMQPRHKTVGIDQVLLPLVIIIACSLLDLIVWQVIDPLVWSREVISGDAALVETVGQCTSLVHGMLPFAVPLAFFTFLAVTTTAFLSWKLRDVQSELSESRWIFTGIFLHLQAWLVGAPVLYLTYGVSSDASYLEVVVLTFTFATSHVALVIGPKILAVLRERYLSDVAGTSSRNISVLGGITHVSGFTPSPGAQERFEAAVVSGLGISPSEGDNQMQQNAHLSDQIIVLKNRVTELVALLERAETNDVEEDWEAAPCSRDDIESSTTQLSEPSGGNNPKAASIAADRKLHSQSCRPTDARIIHSAVVPIGCPPGELQH